MDVSGPAHGLAFFHAKVLWSLGNEYSAWYTIFLYSINRRDPLEVAIKVDATEKAYAQDTNRGSNSSAK